MKTLEYEDLTPEEKKITLKLVKDLQNPKEQERAALHEACHFVFAVAGGMEVEYITGEWRELDNGARVYTAASVCINKEFTGTHREFVDYIKGLLAPSFVQRDPDLRSALGFSATKCGYQSDLAIVEDVRKMLNKYEPGLGRRLRKQALEELRRDFKEPETITKILEEAKRARAALFPEKE